MWAWRDKDVHALKAACQQTSVQIVNINGHRTGSMVARQTHPALVADVAATILVARELGCTCFMMITNQLNGDDSAQPYPEIADADKRNNVVRALCDILGDYPG